MTDKPSDAPATEGPTRRFGATAWAAAASAVAFVASVASSLIPEGGPAKITPATASGAELGVTKRMAELTEDGKRPAPYGIYRLSNPGEPPGILEVMGQPDEAGCQQLIVSGAGVTTATKPNGNGKDVPVGRPMRFCPDKPTTP